MRNSSIANASSHHDFTLQTLIPTALPAISQHFESSTIYIWSGVSFLIANSASTPLWWKLPDIFGRKAIFLAANLLFIVGSLLAALSFNTAMMIASRTLQGAGAGGMITLVNICIGDMFSTRNRRTYYGIIGGIWGLGHSVGPILGGLLTRYAGWRYKPNYNPLVVRAMR